MRLVVMLCLLLLTLVPLESTLAHPGGLDSQGGHRDSAGGYHFHEGPLAGQAFPSREAALEALSTLTPTPQPPSPEPPITPITPPATPSEDTITLASWNVRNLSTGSRSDAELGIISLILFRYDFIALQEVRDADVIRRILQIFEKDFQVSYAAEVSGEVGHNKKERYAFLWRSDRIQQTQAGSFYADPGDKFEREPFCASFRAGTFDWTLCTVHLLFGDSEEDRRPQQRPAWLRCATPVLRPATRGRSAAGHCG